MYIGFTGLFALISFLVKRCFPKWEHNDVRYIQSNAEKLRKLIETNQIEKANLLHPLTKQKDIQFSPLMYYLNIYNSYISSRSQIEQELKELMECFPSDMSNIVHSFDHVNSINKKLLIETIIFSILYVGFILVLVYTFNYLDADYYYWAPALSIIILGMLTLFLIYNSCRFAASTQISTRSAEYQPKVAEKIEKFYEHLSEINTNIEIHIK